MSANEHSQLATHRALIVEDDEQISYLLEFMLRRARQLAPDYEAIWRFQGLIRWLRGSKHEWQSITRSASLADES